MFQEIFSFIPAAVVDVDTMYDTHFTDVTTKAPRISVVKAACIYRKELENFMPGLAIVREWEGHTSHNMSLELEPHKTPWEKVS